MKNFAFILLAALAVSSFACSSRKGVITMNINGWGDDTIMVETYSFYGDSQFDSAYSVKGKFEYTPNIDEISGMIFHRTKDMYPRRGGDYLPYTRFIKLVVAPGDRLKVVGKPRADTTIDYIVKGSRMMEDFSKVRPQTLPYYIEMTNSEFGLIHAMERGASQDETEPFFARRRELYREIAKIERDFIRSNPDRELSAHLLISQPWDSLPVLYDLLTDKVKNGILKTTLDGLWAEYEEYQTYLKNKEKEFVGQPAPDFTLMDIDGKTFRLSDYDTKGKYTVLDFWGSWCGPCLAGVPEMRDYHQRYGDKLEIITIACKDNDADWKKAIADNEMAGIHLFNDESALDKNVSLIYAIEAFPTKIILSLDKTVQDVFKGEGPDFYEKLDQLLR